MFGMSKYEKEKLTEARQHIRLLTRTVNELKWCINGVHRHKATITRVMDIDKMVYECTVCRHIKED